jgi:hypothetical protein
MTKMKFVIENRPMQTWAGLVGWQMVQIDTEASNKNTRESLPTRALPTSETFATVPHSTSRLPRSPAPPLGLTPQAVHSIATLYSPSSGQRGVICTRYGYHDRPREEAAADKRAEVQVTTMLTNQTYFRFVLHRVLL